MLTVPHVYKNVKNYRYANNNCEQPLKAKYSRLGESLQKVFLAYV